MKVIKSPIVYEAELFHSKGNIPKWVKKINGVFFVETKYSHEMVSDGDYVVMNPDGYGESYSEEEFRRIFERVE